MTTAIAIPALAPDDRPLLGFAVGVDVGLDIDAEVGVMLLVGVVAGVALEGLADVDVVLVEAA